jgi:hypothetical protein
MQSFDKLSSAAADNEPLSSASGQSAGQASPLPSASPAPGNPSNPLLSSLAFSQGRDVHVGPGQAQHLPHEAWHVVQQQQGRVQPTMQGQG